MGFEPVNKLGHRNAIFKMRFADIGNLCGIFELRAYCLLQGITIKPYQEIYDYVGKIAAGNKVLLDPGIVNYQPREILLA